MIASLPPRPLPQYETHLASSHRHACHAYRTYCRICYIRYLRHGRIVLHRNTSLARLVATLTPGSLRPSSQTTGTGVSSAKLPLRARCARSLRHSADPSCSHTTRPDLTATDLHAQTSMLMPRRDRSHRAPPRTPLLHAHIAHHSPSLHTHDNCRQQQPQLPLPTATATANCNCHENKTLDEAPLRTPLRSLSLGD